MARTVLAVAFAALSGGLLPAPAAAQAPLRKIGEMELQLAGLGAVLDPVNPVVPKNTPAGVQVIVRAGGRQLTASEVETLVGGAFIIEAELNGPGLPRTITIPDLASGDPLPADPLILPLPGLNLGGDYELTNIRIVSGGRAVMGVLPEVATLKVIDQVLVTKLVTRPLTLDELKEKGIEITSKDYTGFQFSLALRLESEVVNLDFPVVFDRKGVVVPQPIDTRVSDPTRKVEAPALPRPPAMIVPVMLLPEGEADAGPDVPLTLANGEPIRIPSVLVIPGNVGYLKQFFSAVVYVANGTPQGSRLFVRDIAGKIQLPTGDDLDPGTADDPLYLAKRIGEDVPPAERAILGIGPDETPGTEDDVAVFAPGEQGQTEWVLVGNGEGFHKIDISLGATLEGLPTGPVRVKGAASGGVLVRNPFFDVTFTVPSVVRDGETFKAAITLNNIGQGDGQDVRIKIDAARMSGLQLLSDAEQSVPLIAAGEAHAFEYEFKSLRTGKVVATYLRFDPEPGVNVQGRVDFTIGVTDEGVPLSPDTLVLPASVNLLPAAVSYQAMRVLGQAWSIANAPRGSLPARITRITRGTVEQKALALAEAGLRVTLRDADDREAALGEALRDLALDFWGGDPVDPGFDRLLRESGAGRAFTEALGTALEPAADRAGGPAAFEAALADVAASGPDFLSLSVVGGVDVALTDSLGRKTVFERPSDGGRASAIPGAVLLPLGPAETAPIVGLLTEPAATGYRLDVAGPAAITLTAPQGGSFVRGTVNADGRAVLAIDLARPEAWVLEQDLDGDGAFESSRPVAMETLEPSGPVLLAASVIGSETLPRAGDFGLNAVLVFDRPVDPGRAGDTSAYRVPNNSVAFAKPQLSGRLVFATLDQPEGPNVSTEIGVSGLADRRGFSRDATLPLRSRLARGGAFVSGRVREAAGTPIDQGSVVYSNVSDIPCALGALPQALARVPLGSDGSYEIRYVRQGACGFEVAAADPDNVLLRRIEARVQRPGERMLLDIVLLGEGGVEGFVRDLAGQPVAGAAVAVTSETDKTRGASAVTDATGHYRVLGLPVGLVSVKAGFGVGLGSATGRIERAGTAALVNVTLDSGAVTVSGSFRQVKDGVERPVAGALMSFLTAGGVAGYVFSDGQGAFRFEGMPVGSFTIQGHGQGPFGPASGSANGFATAGQEIESFALLHLAKPESVLGTVRGRVLMPGTGDGAAGVIVAQDVSTGFIQNATGTGADGSFELAGLPTGVALSISAITPDRRRRGSASAFIDPGTREQDGIVITLSAIGSAAFTVLGPNGAVIGNQEVALLGVGGFAGVCRNPCGCRTGVTNGQGQVTFADLPLGAYTAQAVRRDGGFTEAATGTAVITREGVPGFGTVRLLGSGTVTGSVSLASSHATFTGGSVSLVSRAFVNDGQFTCGMIPQESHKAQVNPLTSRYEFRNVAVGQVSVTGRSDLGVAANKGNLKQAGETLALDLVFVDTIAGELDGRVFLPSGTPAGAGVEVTVNGPLPDVTVSTDADSRFVFAKVLPQGRYSITARDPVTGGVVRESIYLRAGQDLRHDLRLLGRGSVRVKVEDALGAAVERAFVTLRETDFPQRRHDRSLEPALLGVATFEGVFEGPFSVEVRDLVGRGGRGSGAVTAPDASASVTVRLNPTGSVRGTFVMPDRVTPIPYALVTLVVNGRAVGQTTTPGTGELIGQFSFDFVPAGPVRVEAEDPLTLRTGFAAGSLEASELTPLDLTVIAKGLGSVRGRVLARVAGGPDEPRPGATVKIAAGSYEGHTLADAAGGYEFAGVPEGAFTVTASVGTHALVGSATGAITADGEALPLDVYLRDSGRVTGRVLRSDGETPAPPSKVTILSTGPGGGSQVTYTREGGLFGFDAVPTGRATLSAEELGGLDRGRGALDVAIGDNPDAEVRFNGVGALVVKTKDASGNAVAGDVRLTGTGAFQWQESIRVPAGGEYRLAKVLAGPVTANLSAKPGDVTLYGTAAGEVGPAQENELVVSLAPSGSVSGRILRAGTLAPAYGASVTLQLSGVGTAAVQADEDGRFTATGIPLVSFDLRASDPVTGGIALLRDRQVPANAETLALGDIELDDKAPLVAILEPADGSVQAGTGGAIVIELADDGAGIRPETLAVYYSSGQAQYASAFQVVGGRATGEMRGLLIGSNTLRVVVKDSADRVGEAEATIRVLGATIRGRVLPAVGSTVEGAVVTAGGRSAVADAAGDFAITGLRGSSYYVTAVDPQTGLSVSQFASVPDGGETSVTLQLPSFARVSGSVRRRFGAEGVPGVVVSVAGAYPRQDETDANGLYELPPLPLGPHTLEASETASGDRGRAVVTLAASGAVSVPIELNGIGSLSVGVKTAGGALVLGADVTVVSSSVFAQALRAKTGPAGEPAVFPRVFAGSVQIQAAFDGLSGAASLVLGDRESLARSVALEPAARIQGVVSAALGGGVAGVSLRLTGAKIATTESLASPAGAFAFDNVPLGAFAIDAETGRGDRGRATGTLGVADVPVAAPIRLNGLGRVKVTVETASGTIVNGAAVTLRSSAPFDGFWSGTTAGGVFEHPDVLAGEITATIRNPANGETVAASGTLAPDGLLDLPVTLDPTASITGVVRAAGGGATVAAASVRIAGRCCDTLTDAGGVFLFRDVPLGTYTLEVRVAGRLRARAAGVVLGVNGETVSRDLELIVTGRVAGKVTKAAAVVQGAFVELSSPTPPWTSSFTATSDVNGDYAIDDVPPGPFTISARKGSDRRDLSESMPEAGGLVSVNLALQSSAVFLPASRSDGNVFGWWIQRSGSFESGLMFPAGGGTPRLLIERDSVPLAFEGPCAPTGSCAVPSEEAQRELVFEQTGLHGLDVTRKLFVPADGYFVRVLDLVTNPGASPVTVSLVEQSDLGGASAVRATSSSDLVASAADQWLVLDDADQRDIWASGAGGFSAFAPVLVAGWGEGGTPPSALSVGPASGRTRVTQRWEGVTLAPGETRAILHFVAAQSDQPRATASGARLVQLPPEALAGLTPQEAAAVLNFDVPSDVVSAVAPLPANDGVAEALAFSGDRETTFRPSSYRYRSQSQHYGYPHGMGYFTSPIVASVSGNPASGVVVPRGPFTVTATQNVGLGLVQAQAQGDFAGGSQTGRADVVFEGTGTLRGFVKRADGTGVAGGWVVLSRGGPSATVLPGASSEFVFPAVPAGTYSVTSNHPLGSTQATVAGIVLPGPCSTTAAGQTCERVERDIVYPALGMVEGVVRTAGGFYIRAKLELLAAGFSRTLRSDSVTGSFRFLDVPPGPYTLRATDENRSHGQVSSLIDVTTGEDPAREVVLLPVGSVAVTATSGGAPLSAAPVHWQSDARSPQFAFGATTSGGGLATVNNVVGDPLRVRVLHPANSRVFGEVTDRITAEAQTVAVTIDVPQVGSISGSLLSRSGQAVPFMGVKAMTAARDDYSQSAGSGATGAFTLTGVPRGALFLRGEIDASGLWSAWDEPATLSGDSLLADARVPVGALAGRASELYELELAAGATLGAGIQGFALGPNAALASYELELYGPDRRLAGRVGGAGTSVSTRILNGVAAGSWLVAARSTSDAPGGYRVGATVRDLAHVFRPYTGGMLELAVRRGGLAVPPIAFMLDNARIDLPPAERSHAGTTDATGDYRVPMRPGPITARLVDPATGDTHTAAGELAADATLRLSIELPPRPTTLTGRVTNGDGRTALPAYLELRLESGALFASTQADALGLYRFDAVPPGRYVLRAHFVGPFVDTPLTLTGGALEQNVAMPIAVVRGVVREPPPDSSGVAGALVELWLAGVRSAVNADAAGAYVFYGPAGSAPAYLRATASDGSGLSTPTLELPWSAGFTGTIVQDLALPESAALLVTVTAPGGGAPAAGALVEVYRDYTGGSTRLREPVTADANGQARLRHFPGAERVRVYAELAGDVGQAFADLVLGAEQPVAIALAESGFLDVGIVDESDEIVGGEVSVQAIEQPARLGGVWSQYENLEGEGVPETRTLRVPVGAYRVVLLDSGGGGDAAAAAEGVLAAGETHVVRLRPGSHVRLPYPLAGEQARFGGDFSCPPPCSGFALTRVPDTEAYPPYASPEAEGRSLRGLRVAGSGVHVRRLQYAPASGAFGRTLTLVTNPGPSPVTVSLDTTHGLEGADTVVTPGGGGVDTSQAWAVVAHASGVQGLVLGSALAPQSLALESDGESPPRLEARHALTLAPGETQGLVSFTLVGLGDDPAPLAARAAALADLTEPGALFGLSNEERAAIVNFSPLPPLGDLAVRVMFASDAVAGATVGVIDDGGAAVAGETTGRDGVARVSGLAPGTYSVVAQDGAGRPGRAVVAVTAGSSAADTVTADVELLADAALGSVEVTATWSGIGGGAPGVRFVLEAAGWSPAWRPSGETDANGLVSFDRVPPGPVLARPDTASVGASVSANVTAGATTPAPFVIDPFATLSGLVLAGDGATPLANAPVAAIDATSGDVLASGRTDESGGYRLDGVRPGAGGVLVRAASPYHAGVTVDSDVVTPAEPGTTGLAPIVLPVGVITGEVSRGGGAVRHPAVVARDSSGSSILAEWTDAQGGFRIVGPVAGQVSVVVVDPATGERGGETLELDPATPQSLYVYLGPAPS